MLVAFFRHGALVSAGSFEDKSWEDTGAGRDLPAPQGTQATSGRSCGVGSRRRTLASPCKIWFLAICPVSSFAISPYIHPPYHLKFLKCAVKTAPVFAHTLLLSRSPSPADDPISPSKFQCDSRTYRCLSSVLPKLPSTRLWLLSVPFKLTKKSLVSIFPEPTTKKCLINTFYFPLGDILASFYGANTIL